MELTQSRNIEAPIAIVWRGLNDPEVLKACIPGCETFEQVSETEWRAVIASRIGPVQARFGGKVQLSDVRPGEGYTLKFEGQGGAAGFANGEARVSLAAAGDAATTLTYTASARVGGKIAQLGSRLVDGAAAKMADDFFARFAERMAPTAVEIATPAPATSPVTPPGGATWIRYAALIGIVVVLVVLYLYQRR
jgi:carbon monoxide dehydrogenase subunit G